MPGPSRVRRAIFVAAAAATGALPLVAQQITPFAPKALTAADYGRAEKALGPATTALVHKLTVQPRWLPDGKFWFVSADATGRTVYLVDPVQKARTSAFDHGAIAASLATQTMSPQNPRQLPFVEISPDGKTAHFSTPGGLRFECDRVTSACRNVPQAPPPPKPSPDQAARVVSPDGRMAAFIRDHNLWVRDLSSNADTQLTTDGVRDFGYATNNAGWVRSDTPVLVWSPDSRQIATFQHDSRGTGEMYLVGTAVGHPPLQAWKYPLPGDDRIFMIERVVIDVAAKRVTRLKMPPDPHRSSACDHVFCGDTWADVAWSADSTTVAFVSTSRDHKEATFRVATAETGAVRTVLQEKAATYFESGEDIANWRYLPASNELIWFSERDNWGQLYLYDLGTGRLKNRITTGEGTVTSVLRVDEKARRIFFAGLGREPKRDPYFLHFYRINFDGTGEVLLTPDDGHHSVTWSPSNQYFLDTVSKPDTAPVTTLRDAAGRLLMELDRGDIAALLATGWKPPTPFSVKARDGKTDLYGLLFRPSNFDATKKYPIVNHIYPGPQAGSVGTRGFTAARGDAQALAELGFVVIQLDGMGTPGRSKSFHDAYFGNMGDNTLPDQVTGMQQLAKRFPWIDVDRAGIYGHSGGGFASAAAMFRYPDFFKVGVSQAGNHDNRHYEDDWAEKWQGLLVRRPDGTTNYDNQANPLVAKNLKGKLLIAHGTMDDNVPPNNTLLVVDALIAANKDFDLIMFPNRGHGFGSEPYMMRRRWDYFVKHLLGAEPPKEYQIGAPAAGRGRGGT